MTNATALYIFHFMEFYSSKEQVYKPGSVLGSHLSVTIGYPTVHAIIRAMPSRLNCAVDVAPDGVYTGIQLPSSL